MPYKDGEKLKEYIKEKYVTTVHIRVKNEEIMLFDKIKEAAQNKGISIQKYMILATKEKLDRDGYI